MIKLSPDTPCTPLLFPQRRAALPADRKALLCSAVYKGPRTENKTPCTLWNMQMITHVWWQKTRNWSHRSDDRNTTHTEQHANDHTGLMIRTPCTLYNMQLITQVWWLKHLTYCTTYNWSQRSDDWNTTHTVQHTTDHKDLMTELPCALYNMQPITQIWLLK